MVHFHPLRSRHPHEPVVAWQRFSLLFTFLLVILILLAIVLLPPAAH